MDSGQILKGQLLMNFEKARSMARFVLMSCCGARMSVKGITDHIMSSHVVTAHTA